MRIARGLAVYVAAGLLSGCATKQDFERLESKVDRLIQATNRSTLDEIFGDQAAKITLMVNDLDAEQRRSFETLQQEYNNGTLAVEEVRQGMLSVLGNNDRIVSTRRGIYIRNLAGAKLKAIPRDTKIVNCRLLAGGEIPAGIQSKRVLQRYSWGQGELNGTPILFPWELTISSFTKEVAEHTAMRTAQEFIKMGGEKQWQRPIKIQITTEKDDPIKITTEEKDSEIFLEYDSSEANQDGGGAAVVGTDMGAKPAPDGQAQ